MIRLRHFIILGLLAVAGWLIGINERALGVELPVRAAVAHVAEGLTSSDTRASIAGRVLLASLVGMSIALTWLWFIVRAAGH